MTNLDDKLSLESKIKLVLYGVLHEENMPLEVAIENIKQAFADLGCITGQEWYDRFMEYFCDSDLSTIEAAKKAAGLE